MKGTPERPRVWFEFQQGADRTTMTFEATGIDPPFDNLRNPALIKVELTEFHHRVVREVSQRFRNRPIDHRLGVLLAHLTESVYADMREEGAISFDMRLVRFESKKV